MLEELESQIRLLELKCRRPVEHLLAGEYHSVFHGQGIEFVDVRPYQPGDDVRMMDWKITARTGEPYIKRYIEEREQFIYLLVDVSASMVSSRNGDKRRTVTELCSLIALSALGNNDRVGLILFSDRIEQLIPPSKGRQHGLRIMDALTRFEPQGQGTEFGEALAHFGQMARKQSVAFVVSDFLAVDYIEELSSLATRHDVNAINVIELLNANTDRDGLVRIEDSETGELRYVDFDRRIAESERHHEQLQERMVEGGVNLLEIAVGEDCVTSLAGFFRSRQRRLADETGG